MSKANNFVNVTGKVTRFVTHYNENGKARAFYQIETEPKGKDEFISMSVFARSVGTQAVKDIENIKVGDYISVVGRLQTRQEYKKVYLKVDEKQQLEDDEKIDPYKLRIVDLDDEFDSCSVDDELYECYVPRQITEIFVEDVEYLTSKMMKLTPKEQAILINDKTVVKLLKEYQEKGLSITELINNLENKVGA